MKKFIWISILFSYSFSFAQTNELAGQYYQNLPAYNPAHTGMNDFLDINMGFRQQWLGFNGSPKNIYVSAYGTFRANKNKAELGEETAVVINQQESVAGLVRKHGLGGYIMSNEQGFYKQREIAATYAYHIPVMRTTYLSVGMSPSLYSEKIVMDVTVKDQLNDASYQSLISNGNSYSSFVLNIGASIYSDRYYLSYSMRQAGKLSLSGNDEVFSSTFTKRHHIMGGIVFHINPKVEVIPNTFVRLDAARPTLFELGVRARYNQNVWGGLSYRNDRTIVGVFGILFKNKYKFSYSYEHKNLGISKDFGISNSAGGSHEVLIGMQVFKDKQEVF
jgi:type IX secretion system PorP/SprF family membrane protein